MIRTSLRLSPLCLAVAAATLATPACRKEESTAPPVATPTVTLSHDRVPAGSPLEITYKFVVANDAHFSEDYRVFVHVVDTDEEQMWTDDHNPSTPTSQWKPGQTIEYTRTIFVPVFPYVGEATIQIGLHSIRDQKRLPLTGENVGQQGYKVAHLQLLPQTDNLFTVFKDGWHPAEVASQDASVEWQWTKKQATLAFKNPKKDAMLYLDVDSPDKQLHGPQQVKVILAGQTIDEFSVTPDDRMLHKIKLPGNLMGEAELAELQIAVDTTFVPATRTNGASKDPRELGIRVFHAVRGSQMRRMLLALALFVGSALPAHAELVFFTSGRTLSIKGHQTDGESLILALRGGGELICEASIVANIAPDEVPYPEPEPAAAAAVSAPRPATAARAPLPTDVRYDPIIRRFAAAHGVDAELVRAVIQVESAYQSRARSGKGAVGLMQVMPATGRQYGVRNLYDPTANIEVGIKHLKSLLERFPLNLALAAYNAGQAAVERFRGVPPYRETEDYVSRVLALVGG